MPSGSGLSVGGFSAFPRGCLALAVLVGLALAPGRAAARTSDPSLAGPIALEDLEGQKLDSLSLEQLLNVVVSSTLVEQDVMDAPSSIVVVTRRQIREHGYRTLKDVMNDVPGFNDVVDTNEEIVAVHGFYASSTNKILILVNGHRMNDFYLGRYNVDQFLGLDMVERVEFIIGPASAIYGTGALVGLVNIITRSGASIDGVSAKARLGMYTREGSLTYGKAHGDLDVLFNLTFFDAPGQEKAQGAELDTVPTGSPASDKRAGFVHLDKYPTNVSAILTARTQNAELTLRGAHFSRATPRTSTGSFYDYDAEPFKPLFTENDFFADFVYRFRLGKPERTLTVNPSVHYFNYFEYSFLAWGVDDSPPLGHRGGQDTEMIDYALKIVYRDQLLSRLHLVAGADTTLAHIFHSDAFNIASGNTVGSLVPSGAAKTGLWPMFGLLAQLVWKPLDWMTITAGGRFDYFHEEADPQFTPRAGVIFRPRDDLSIKLLYGMSYLAPMWAHKRSGISTFQGNPDLGPEVFHGVHLVGMWDFRKVLSTTVDVYYAELGGLINQVPVAGTTMNTYRNFGRAPYAGFDLSAGVSAVDTPRLKLSFNVAYSLIRPVTARIDEPVIDETTSKKLTFLTNGSISNVPTHTLRYGLRVEPLARLVLAIWGRLYSPIETVDPILGDASNSRARTLPVIALLDAAATYSIRGFDLQLLLRNLTNCDYELGGTTPRPLPRMGLSVEGMVGYTF
jgi:outer membrane receptor protein involved in Fe transport